MTDSSDSSDGTTYEQLIQLVQTDGLALEDIDDDEKTKHICLKAVKQNGLALKFVPRYLQTQKIKLAAVRQNGMALQYVKLKEKYEQYSDEYNRLCLEAVHQTINAFQFVPENNYTYDICTYMSKHIDIQHVIKRSTTFMYKMFKIENGLVFRLDHNGDPCECEGFLVP